MRNAGISGNIVVSDAYLLIIVTKFASLLSCRPDITVMVDWA